MLRLLTRLFLLTTLCGVAWGVMFLSSSAFGERWRTFVTEQMAERGVYVRFSRLSIDPFRGLVARDVQIFNDENRRQVVATLDRVNLDFDLGRLLRGEVVVESLDLAETNLSLPVDPDHPDLTVVNVTDVSARIFVVDDRLDIRRAEGDLAGIHLSVTGALILTPKKGDAEQRKKSREENATKRLKFIRDNRQQIQTALQWLSRFQFAQKPRVQIEVNGVVERVHEMEARLTLSARGLGYGSYVCQEIEAQAQYNAGFFDLTRLFLRDKLGTLDASGGWQSGGNEVSFRLSTSADLHGLASAFLNNDFLKEMVLYEPPSLSVDGTWYVGGPKSKAARPVNVLGKLQSGRFNSRGEIFDGIGISFGVDPAGFYLRDGLLRHKSGTLGFQAMYHEAQGLKYRATVKMDPSAFLPFLAQESSREVIGRFGFKESSSIFVRVEGAGGGPKLATTRTTGRAELRAFSYQGVEFDAADGDLELAGPEQTFRNINARRGNETVAAQEVHVDNTERWVRLSGVTGRLDPVVMMGCFAPKVASYISRYKLSPATGVSVSGTVGWRDSAHNDLKALFRDEVGTAIYSLWDRDYAILAPVGEVTYKGHELTYDVAGRVFGKPMSAKGRVDLAPGASDYTVSLKAGSLPYKVIEKDLPFTDVTVGVAAEKGTVAFDIGAGIFGGTLSLKGSTNTKKTPAQHQGELRLNAASFRQFAQTYSPGYDTEGDLTGDFKFTAVQGDWQQLKGTGAAIIVNGNLYAIPIIGPLTSLLTAVIPSPVKGYNVAKEANCTYTVADGFIVTNNFEALTSTFKIVTNGNIDFIKNDIDFGAQVRVRGITGLVLRPVSELLEYKGTGTVGKPHWRLNPFGISGGKKEGQRQAPPVEETKGDERPEGMKEKDGSLPARLKRILPFGGGGK